jgi:hypothetical protein
VTPAWIGHGDNERVVIARFAETLPDDVYRIEILGVDLASEGRSAIRNTEGEALRPRRAGTDRDTYYMNLELGARVVAVVPEPVERTGTALTQRKNQIDIYFNNDPLHDVAVTTSGVNDPTVVTPAFYQLIMTQDTTTPNDDVVILPTSVSYDPVTNKAVLTFAQAISSFGDRAETFRLRVGSREVVPNNAAPSTPTIITPAADPGDTLVSSTDLGTLAGSSSFILREEVRAGSGRALPDYPGSNFDPGHRDIQDESHQGGAPDADPDITVLTYTFALGRSYGVDTAGRPLFSTISPDQMQRVREIFEFYAAQMGINFVESPRVLWRSWIMRKPGTTRLDSGRISRIPKASSWSPCTKLAICLALVMLMTSPQAPSWVAWRILLSSRHLWSGSSQAMWMLSTDNTFIGQTTAMSTSIGLSYPQERRVQFTWKLLPIVWRNPARQTPI